ncbi:hypothetical protein CLOP_g13178 [Closterium sp. NIES-67]|nr:hypothetical protein CLOP_g13178 [Closterium sp. NIES-67]
MAISHVLARPALPAQLHLRSPARPQCHVASHSARLPFEFSPLVRDSRASPAVRTGLRGKPLHGTRGRIRQRLAPGAAVDARGDAGGLTGDRVRAEGEKRRAGERSEEGDGEADLGVEKMSQGECEEEGEEEEEEEEEGEEGEEGEEYEEEGEDEEEWDEDWDEDQEGEERAEGAASGRGGEPPVWEGEGVEVGVIVGAHGLRGEVRVKPLTDFPEQRFGQGGWRWLKRPGRPAAPSPRAAPSAVPPPPATAGGAAAEAAAGVQGGAVVSSVWVRGGRPGPGRYGLWLVKLKGVESAEQAEALRGSVMMVPVWERPELEEDEVYSSDLIGLQVLLKEGGVPIGVVEDVGAYVWIPFVRAIVPLLDLQQRRIVVDPPPGLLELNQRAAGKAEQAQEGEGEEGSTENMSAQERRKRQQRRRQVAERYGEAGQQHVVQWVEQAVRLAKAAAQAGGEGGAASGPVDVDAALQQLLSVDLRRVSHAVQRALAHREHLHQLPLPVPVPQWPLVLHRSPLPTSAQAAQQSDARTAGEAWPLRGAPGAEGPVGGRADGAEGLETEGRQAVREGRVAVVALLGAAAAGDAVREGGGSGAGGGAAGMARQVEEYVRRDTARLRKQMNAVDQWRDAAGSPPLPWLLVVDDTASPFNLHQSLLAAAPTTQPSWIPLPQWPLFSLNPRLATSPSNPPPSSSSSPPPSFRMLLHPLPPPEAELPSATRCVALQMASGGEGCLFLALKDAAVLRGLAKQGVKHLLVLLHPTAQPDPALIAACIHSNADVAVAASASTTASSAGVLVEGERGGQQVLRLAAFPSEQQGEGREHGAGTGIGNGSGSEGGGKKKGKGKGKGKEDERRSSGVRLYVLEGGEVAGTDSHVHSLDLFPDQLVVSMKFLKWLDPMQVPFQLHPPSPLEQHLPAPQTAAGRAARGEDAVGGMDGGMAVRQRAMDVVSMCDACQVAVLLDGPLAQL